MGLMDRLFGAMPPLALPKTEALGRPGPQASWAYDPNPLSEGYVFEDLTDPRLSAFLGGGRQASAGVSVR